MPVSFWLDTFGGSDNEVLFKRLQALRRKQLNASLETTCVSALTQKIADCECRLRASQPPACRLTWNVLERDNHAAPAGITDAARRNLSRQHHQHMCAQLQAIGSRLLHATPMSMRCSTTTLFPGQVSLFDHDLDRILPECLRSPPVVRDVILRDPSDWNVDYVPSPTSVDHLSLLHAHVRDANLAFEAKSHTYTWCGRKTYGSVTGLIHRFVEPFDEDAVLCAMRRSRNWPRCNYLRAFMPLEVLQEFQEMGAHASLLHALATYPLDEEYVLREVHDFVSSYPQFLTRIAAKISLSDSEIKTKWKQQRQEGATRGSWMHSKFECLLNAGAVMSNSHEVLLFLRFLQNDMQGRTAFRTEWMIFATEENIAGSIDFVAKARDGSLVLIDWKRSRNLRNKLFSYGRFMGAPLGTVPDSTLWHYRLQLNCYAWILQTYYDCVVSKMLVVCTHPDNGSQPFVDNVPWLSDEVSAMMQIQRTNWQLASLDAADSHGGSSEIVRELESSTGDVRGGSNLEEVENLPFSTETLRSPSLVLSPTIKRETERADTLELEERIHGAFLLPSDSFAARAEESENETHAAGAIDDSSPTNVRALSQLDVVKNEIPAEEDMTAKIKKRRMQPGCLNSHDDFSSHFALLRGINESFQLMQPDSYIDKDTILNTVATYMDVVRQQAQGLSDKGVRLLVAALSVLFLRQVDLTILQHAMLLWITEGNTYLRFHYGDCYMRHTSGAFQAYKGIPPEATCARVHSFLLILEGMFRLLPPQTQRQENAVLEKMHEALLAEVSEESFFVKARQAAAASHCTDSRKRKNRHQPAEHEFADVADMSDSDPWPLQTARTIMSLKSSLIQEITQQNNSRLFSYMIEWCDSARNSQAGCCYEDAVVLYPEKSGCFNIQRHLAENLYLRIPHCIFGKVPPDVLEKVQKFYAQTFWGNEPVFRCCQAAQALAKRGDNVVRLFIGLSRGGVGQSLYSAHLHAIYVHNFGFFDPNIWYDENEMRKQIEQYSNCCILTGQEVPGTSKRLREDLFKKFMSAEGIADRKPYGMQTRMIRCNGWKRIEANRMISLNGVEEHEFNAILRRGFCWQVKSQFEDKAAVDKLHDDVHRDGIFPKDPDLKEFLISGPAILAALQLQHAFESKHTKAQCLDMIEQWAYFGGDDGLTEKHYAKHAISRLETCDSRVLAMQQPR